VFELAQGARTNRGCFELAEGDFVSGLSHKQSTVNSSYYLYISLHWGNLMKCGY